MDFETVLASLGPVGPFLPPLVGVYWLTKVVKLGTRRGIRIDDELFWELFGGLAMMYVAIDYSVGVIRTPESSLLQDLVVIVTGVSLLITLDEIYQRVGSFIKARRASS